MMFKAIKKALVNLLLEDVERWGGSAAGGMLLTRSWNGAALLVIQVAIIIPLHNEISSQDQYFECGDIILGSFNN